jgi:uncharacterized protein (DUF885 family)
MASVTEISDRYVTDIAALDPVRGERWGVASDPTRLTDYSPDGYAALADLLRRTLADLATATPASEPERLGQGFLADWLDGELGVIVAGERERWLSNITGPAMATRGVFDLMDTSTPQAWEDIGARLHAVPAALAGYRATLQKGLDEGRPAARRQAVVVAEQCETWAGSGDDGGWFGVFVDQYGHGAQRTALDRAARAAATAYADLAHWLRTDYAPKATDADGAGDERYQVWARFLLGARLDIDEAYAWAWEELGRLEAEKALECERILPGAGFDAVRELLIEDPKRQVHGVDAYREWLQYVTDEAISGLSGRQFDIPDSVRRCEIRIPPEGSAAAAYYTSPSEDLTRPGRAWFPAMGRTSFPTWDDVSTVYHEAVPGHHLQNAAIRLVPLTRAHKLGFISAHGEGWALYAERLMDELGWFRTPETRLGFLCAHAFRAARIVVDIGLHTGRPIPAGWEGHESGWSYELAIRYMIRAGGMAYDKAESEVLRYLSWPSQATAYKLGERTWLAGREAARKRQGAAFDLKRWHANALALGPLGLDRLGAELEKA